MMMYPYIINRSILSFTAEIILKIVGDLIFGDTDEILDKNINRNISNPKNTDKYISNAIINPKNTDKIPDKNISTDISIEMSIDETDEMSIDTTDEMINLEYISIVKN